MHAVAVRDSETAREHLSDAYLDKGRIDDAIAQARQALALQPESADAHANFVYLPSWREPWREVFDGTGLQVRHYADGGVRITVGNRQSTRAVLAAVAPVAVR